MRTAVAGDDEPQFIGNTFTGGNGYTAGGQWSTVYVTVPMGDGTTWTSRNRVRMGPLADYKLDETGLTWKLHRASGEYRLTDLTEGRPLTPAPRSPLDEPLRWECTRLRKELDG